MSASVQFPLQADMVDEAISRFFEMCLFTNDCGLAATTFITEVVQRRCGSLNSREQIDFVFSWPGKGDYAFSTLVQPVQLVRALELFGNTTRIQLGDVPTDDAALREMSFVLSVTRDRITFGGRVTVWQKPVEQG